MVSQDPPIRLRFAVHFGIIGAVLASVMIGASAAGIAKKDQPKAEVGSCAACSGLPSGEGPTAGMIFIAGGIFTMGSNEQQPEERFTHVARVDGFWIDRHEVTNAQSRNLSTKLAM
jgi:formylglycine-generating enzyme required for sulfatase activity